MLWSFPSTLLHRHAAAHSHGGGNAAVYRGAQATATGAPGLKKGGCGCVLGWVGDLSGLGAWAPVAVRPTGAAALSC